MTLNEFKQIVEFQFNYITNGKNIEAETLTDKYLIISGLTVIMRDVEDKALTIEEALDTFKKNDEKEEFLQNLVWAIPGGAGVGDIKFDLNKDGKLDEKDVEVVKAVASKEEPTEEELKANDVTGDSKVDERDVEAVKRAVSEVTPEVKPTAEPTVKPTAEPTMEPITEE